LVSKRQVIEIPPIKPLYIEYRQYGTECPCGHRQKAAYPEGVNAPIQYGSSVIALVSYFNVYQYVAYKRLSQLFGDVFSLPISEGSIENLLNKAAQKAPVQKSMAKNGGFGYGKTSKTPFSKPVILAVLILYKTLFPKDYPIRP